MKFFIQKKIIMLKNYFQFKDNKNYVGGLYIKIHFTCLSKCKMKFLKNYPQINTKCTIKKHFLP